MMFYPNSAPLYSNNHCIQEYLDIYYVWMVRVGADGKALKTLSRLARIYHSSILTPSHTSLLTESLNTLAENLKYSEIKVCNLSIQLEKIEINLNTLCSKSRLVSAMFKIESRLSRIDSSDCKYRPLFRKLFQKLDNLEFSKIQVEGIIRDLKENKAPNPEELQELLNNWI